MIGLSGKFVDFYVVLGVRADASHEEIWAAYNRKKAEGDSLGQAAQGNASRDKLLDVAIAVLGAEEKRLAYDFKGEGGTVDFEVNMKPFFYADPSAVPAGRQNGDLTQPSWAGYQDGAVIQGSGRMNTTAYQPAQAQPPAPQPPEPAPQQAAPAPVQERLVTSGQPQSGISPMPTLQAEGPFPNEIASNDFSFRTTAQTRADTFGNHNYQPPRPYAGTGKPQAEESALSQLLSKTTFILGLFFALLLSITWMLELPLIGGFLPAGDMSPLKFFLSAANEAHIVKLWILVFCGGFVLWCAEIFTIQLACGALDSSFLAMSAARQRDAQKVRGRVLGAEIFLSLALCAAFAILPHGLDFIRDKAAVREALHNAASLLYFFIPLFLVSRFVGQSPWSAVVWQVSLLIGHMSFVLLMEALLLGSASLTRYFTGELFKFGYASWWFLFYFGYKWYVRMNAR